MPQCSRKNDAFCYGDHTIEDQSNLAVSCQDYRIGNEYEKNDNNDYLQCANSQPCRFRDDCL